MNPEAIEAAAKASYEEANFGHPWERVADEWKTSYRNIAKTALEAALPYLIRESALKRMVSMPWFEELVMAEAMSYHSGGNCRFETEARAAELETAAEAWTAHQAANMGLGSVQQIAVWLTVRAAAIRNST